MQYINGDIDLLTTRDVMEMLNVSYATIVRWRKTGKLPYIRLSGVGGHVRFKRTDIEKMIRRVGRNK